MNEPGIILTGSQEDVDLHSYHLLSINYLFAIEFAENHSMSLEVFADSQELLNLLSESWTLRDLPCTLETPDTCEWTEQITKPDCRTKTQTNNT